MNSRKGATKWKILGLAAGYLLGYSALATAVSEEEIETDSARPPHSSPHPHPKPPAPHPHPHPKPPHPKPPHPKPPHPKPPHPKPPHPGHGVKPGHPVKPIKPPHTVPHTKPSHWKNPHTHQNFGHSFGLNKGFKSGYPHLVGKINLWSGHYKNHYHLGNQHAWNKYFGFYHNHSYHWWYSAWFRWGFYGGFWYPVRPCFVIYDYFYYPMVSWFYVEAYDPEIWLAYYPGDPMPAECNAAFPYPRVYFPTDTLRDMLVEVSGMDGYRRCNFRQAAIRFTEQLRDLVQAQTSVPFQFADNEIVLNYYQNLQNRALEVSGFVSRGDFQVAFKGILELENPSMTTVFVPMGQDPTQGELNTLETLNDRIKSLGGDPYTATEEPEKAPEILPENPSPDMDDVQS